MLQCFAAASIRSACRFASTALSRSHPSLLLGGPACRSPGVAQAKATPRPHPSLLLGGPACRSPGVTRFKPFKRLNILLACLIPQPTGTPRPHQWLLMGVQACRLPALKPLKPLKGLKPLKLCKSFSERPNPAGKSCPKATSIASSGRSSLPLATYYLSFLSISGQTV